jgi:hypothetical protein
VSFGGLTQAMPEGIEDTQKSVLHIFEICVLFSTILNN